MIRSPISISGSAPDLSSDLHGRSNVTQRKRKHSNEYQDLLDAYTDRVMGKLTEWKTEIGKTNSEINDKLAGLTLKSEELKSEINSMRSEYTEIKDSIKKLNNTEQDKMQKEITVLQESIQFNSNQQTDITKEVRTLSKDVQKASSMKSDIIKLQRENLLLKSQLNMNDQRERMLNLEIIGIHEIKGENLFEIMCKIGDCIGVALNQNDIIEVHRVTPKTKLVGRPRVIIAKMRSRQLRDNIISRARRCRINTKDLEIHGELKPIYVNEHLTIHNKLILKKTKETAKAKEYQYVWTKNGRIYARKNDTSQAILIAADEDLKKIT